MSSKLCLFYQIKSIWLNGKIVDCVFNDYRRGGKSYEMLGMEPEGKNFINHRCITFSESHHKKKCKDTSVRLLETMTEMTQFEEVVSTMDASSCDGSNYISL